MHSLKDKKIFVGLSGGVDSSVTAALLQKAGADVYGVFIQGWYPPTLACTWKQDRRDAMRVAAHLNIPFHTLNASKEYKESVLDYLVREYSAGRTPNPDIMCNKDVKFGIFYNFAMKNNADFIATGHYAQVTSGVLSRGVDPEKDQSYFLWALSPFALEKTVFPLGGMNKDSVRKRAKHFNLPTALKRDSQGICFLGDISLREYLKTQCAVSVGQAYNENGLSIGTHEGALLYTVGERVALAGVSNGPWYVVSKDMSRNSLVVSHEKNTVIPCKKIHLSNTNFFRKPHQSEVITAQFRYHGPLVKGVFKDAAFTPDAQLPEILAPGQSLVLYKDEEVLGGGSIESCQ